MPAAKPKPKQLTLLQTWTDVDRSLARQRALTNAIEATNNTLNARRRTLDSQLARNATKLKSLRDQQRAVERYTLKHLPDLEPARSRELNHGVVSVRLAKRLLPLPGSNWSEVLDGLKAPLLDRLGVLLRKLAGRYVRVRFEINKQQAFEDYQNGILTDDDLARLGMRMYARNAVNIKLADHDARPTA